MLGISRKFFLLRPIIKRVSFNSITKDAVLKALENPRAIDIALVNAQQARRLLDRIVGYKISPSFKSPNSTWEEKIFFLPAEFNQLL